MRKNKIFALMSAAALAVAAFCGCSGSASKELTKVTIALDWTPNTNHTGIYVANELGYFKDAGIEVEIIEALESGAESVVSSGTAQFGISFQDYLVPAFSAPEGERLPITVIAAIIQHNTSGIISPKELGITTPAKLCGHTYATWELPIEQAIMENVVTADGGKWDDVELIPQYVENIQGAFDSGIDSVWIYYAWDGINTELAKIDTNFFYFKDYGEELDYYSPVIIGNNDYMDKNPEITAKFMEAVSKGYEYSIENPEDAAKILVNANEGLDLELCTASQKWLADKYTDDASSWGVIDSTRWNAFFTWVYENDLCEYEIPRDYGFTNEYLPE
ncbi:MAG: ABC transporter substrate-binding protein [Butyrivibrio sp.]